jgi:hypothetical protein
MNAVVNVSNDPNVLKIDTTVINLLTHAIMLLNNPDMGGKNYSKAIARIKAARHILLTKDVEIPEHIKRSF